MASSLKDLLAERAEIERRIAEAQREERAAAIAKVKELMAEYGLTAADLAGKSGSSRGSKSAGKVAPKYRNSATGETWSGRGLQPKWLRAALAAGAKISDFAI